MKKTAVYRALRWLGYLALCVGAGQVVHQAEGEAISHRYILNEATRRTTPRRVSSGNKYALRGILVRNELDYWFLTPI